MTQEINEIGSLEVTTVKNVVFKSRTIRNISITDSEKCHVNVLKSSEDGDLIETVTVPTELFNDRVGNILWELIDEQKEGAN